MKKIASFIVRLRALWMALLLLACVPAALCIPRTVINYDITSYLQEDTQTKRGLELMSREFETPSSEQVLLICGPEEAAGLAEAISEIDGVISASFDETADTRTAQNGTVYRRINVLLAEDRADAVYSDIEDLLRDVPHRVSGAAKDSRQLRSSIQQEIPPVMLVSCVIVLVILLLMSTSFVEPLLFFAVIGVSIVLNMGTNWIFPSISFVTFAVAAILQLALSMDYSIILINAYDRELQGGRAPRGAMVNALASSFMPILSSSLTTVAGMVSLMFMVFTFGFDIGMVLAKGILLSMLTVFLLLPGLLLLFTPLMRRTRHVPLRLRGRLLCRLLRKSRGVLAILLILLILCGAVLQSRNVYAYTALSTDEDTALIEDLYGHSSQVVVLFPKGNTDADYARQEAALQALSAITVDGKPMVQSTYAMVTTGAAVLKEYTLAEAAQMLGLEEALFARMAALAGITFPVRGDVLIEQIGDAVWRKNYTAADVATLFGVNENVIAGYAAAFGITLPAPGDQVINRLYEAVMVQQRSSDEIARMLGMNPVTLNMYAALAGIRFPATVIQLARSAYSAASTLSFIISIDNLRELLDAFRLVERLPEALLYMEQIRAQLDSARSAFDGHFWSRAVLLLDIDYLSPGAEKAVEQIFDVLSEYYGENWAVTGMLIAIHDIAVTFAQDLRRVSVITVLALLLIIALSFRSIVIPLLLVCVIQGAVYVNMALSGLLDGSIFFMCYLICLALQMGATIDYGILFTSHYRSARQMLMQPWEAAADAMDKSMQTILTSGLALITAGFTVGRMSSVFYISSIGTMLGRGAVISVALILLLLPQLLVWLDRWVLPHPER